MKPEPVSIIFAMVKSRDDGKYHIEYEILWSDGSLTSKTATCDKPVRVNLEEKPID